MTAIVTHSLHNLKDDLHTAFKQWHDASTPESGLIALPLFRQFQTQQTSSARQAINRLLLEALTRLEAENSRGARLLRLRFLDKWTAYAAANELNLAESTAFKLQGEAFDQLTHIVAQWNEAAQQQLVDAIEQRLEPPTYNQLIGVEEHLQKLAERLTVAGPPWLVAIEGIGGIGKTALAHALVRHLLTTAIFADIAWVTARQEHFDLGGGLRSLERPALTAAALIDALLTQLQPTDSDLLALPTTQKLAALQSRLTERPHLIVIDNLETVADLECLLPTLRQLADPSRFLLTSRRRLDGESGIYHFALPALKQPDALALVRQEAALHNLAHVVNASDAELLPIYTTVGGNPLALRLVVGQTHVHGLNLLLEDLVQARGQKVENLYTYLYRRAWESLDETARLTWLSLPLVIAESATLATLTGIVPIPMTDLRHALETLVRLSLIDCQGTLHERRYVLHSLTRTFLQEQVARWK